MRPTILFLNFVVVLFFGVFFAYTFVAKAHLKKLGRDYALSQTVSYADPLVDSAEKKFQRLQKLVPAKQKKIVQAEFDNYRKNPADYIGKLADKSSSSASKAPLLQKFAPFKDKIQIHLDKKLAALLQDLRIFAGSNVIAGAIAFLFAFRSPAKLRSLLVWLSFLMFLAICFASYIYIDDFSFFKILNNFYMGWTYPCLLSYFIVRLFWDGWRGHEFVEKIDQAVNPTDIKTKPNP